MKNKSKILSFIIFILTLILLGLIVFITAQKNFVNLYDFIPTLPYFIILVISSLIVMIKSEKLLKWIKFSINGLLIGGGISLLIIFISMLPRLKLIINDGTSLWMFVWLPIMIIGYSLTIIGVVLGLIIGIVRSKSK
ncbi:hypothetical protein J4429_06110 [Candidatus Pacearchaeota archaeon]|nr:hypothetical protein [Candidatus Pacearchaeota archaeon]